MRVCAGCTSLDRIWKPGKIVKETSDYAREPVVDLVGLYLRSVFCLQPTGTFRSARLSGLPISP